MGKFGLGVQNEAGQRLTEFWQENALAIANTVFQQHKEMTLHVDITRWSKSKSDFICSWSWKSSKQRAKIRPGAVCGSDHQLPVGKPRLKSKTVGKTIKPFRSHLNQIPYDYTVEVTNRFKGLDLIERVPEELWTEGNIVQEAVIKTIPKKEIQQGKMVVWGGLTNSWEEKWKAKEKRKDILIWMQCSKE